MISNQHKAQTAAAALLLAAGTASGMTSAPDAGAALYYGAIAVAPNGVGAESWGYSTRAAAEDDAVQTCGYSSCKALTSYTDCGAVAANDLRYQGGHGATLALAQIDALSRLRGGDGYIAFWSCA